MRGFTLESYRVKKEVNYLVIWLIQCGVIRLRKRPKIIIKTNGQNKEIKAAISEDAELIEKLVKHRENDTEFDDLCNFYTSDGATNSGVYIYCLTETLGRTQIGIYNEVKKAPKIDLSKLRNGNNILYVGKSYNMNKRKKEHQSKGESSPYSLKLGNPKRTSIKCEMKEFYLKKEYLEYKEIIIPLTEQKLHELLKPISGTCRL